MSETAQKSHTCPQNASKHPGLTDLPAKGHQRWTKAQIAEDNQILKESREVQEQAALEGLQRLATMQKEMEKVEELTKSNMPKPARPRAHPVVKRTAPDKKVLMKGNTDLEESGRDDSSHVQEGISEKSKTQKRGKISLKDAINNARDLIATPGIRSQEPRCGYHNLAGTYKKNAQPV
ncbi:hypothetical protein DFJ58DRAFT_729474 [Suillus subalutaceus]|uniref:uncharacterized protein n=1 Tax=Suillus subalutaceus TaxID=48586 RepID=UPI001B8838AE|nr:uncharacterized protein DFJ58DRAFT_729474 [Suillus subalutaceus]KAG1849690.1 hypothetical protein DFJ58DRAFT_729474 [Suillus subalutaceus]